MNNASPLKTVGQVLTDGGLDPQLFVHEASQGFVMDLGDELYEGAIAHILEEDQQFVFYLDFREKATERTHAEVTEFLTWVNHGMLVGNFELDYEDGNARFRSGIDYEGTELSYNLVRNAMIAARKSAECYGPALVQVIAGAKTAKEAIAEAQAAMNKE